MSSSTKHPINTPATLEALINAIAKMGLSDEGTLKDAISSGKLNQLVKLHLATSTESMNDFASDEELVEASPLPLSTKQHLELIRASMPLRSHEQARLQNNPLHQDGLEGLGELLSAIHALISEEGQRPPAEDTIEDKS